MFEKYIFDLKLHLLDRIVYNGFRFKSHFLNWSYFKIFNFIIKSFESKKSMRWKSKTENAVAVHNTAVADEECSSISEARTRTEKLCLERHSGFCCGNLVYNFLNLNLLWQWCKESTVFAKFENCSNVFLVPNLEDSFIPYCRHHRKDIRLLFSFPIRTSWERSEPCPIAVVSKSIGWRFLLFPLSEES